MNVPSARFAEAEPYRLRDRALEAQVSGANLLLDAFAVVDLSVAEAVEAARTAGRPLVCGSGCAQCCRQPIPVTPLEALVLGFFLHKRLPKIRHAAFMAGIGSQRAQEVVRWPCPFLCDAICICYDVRPLACRRYLATGRQCAPNEEIIVSRPADLVRPCYDALHAALLHTLPWYQDRPEYSAACRGDKMAFFRTVTTIVQALPWGAASV